MTGFDDVTRFPALIVGVGGSGVRALRYMQWMAENGSDAKLAHMLKDGSLQLVGIDTDYKANMEGVTVSEYVMPRPKGWTAAEQVETHRILPQIEQWVTVKTEDIMRAWEAARAQRQSPALESASITIDQNGRWTDPEVAQPDAWLPQFDRDVMEQMSIGQARGEGAGQWRLFGRLGLFTRAPEIYTTLEKALKRVKDAGGPDRPARVFLVCSLAGGTGSGMFWDIAFMLRLIDPGCLSTACFLLAEAFRGTDKADRIDPNTYAALKELAAYKNWRLAPGEKYPVEYPIGHKGMTFTGHRGADSVFNLVYIFQGFGTTDRDAPVIDVAGGTIELTCFRVAQTILIQLREDLRAAIDEGANNDLSDVNIPMSRDERGFVFSTATVVPLDIATPTHIALILRGRLVERMLNWANGRGTYPKLTFRDVTGWLCGGTSPHSPLARESLDYCEPLKSDDPAKEMRSLITLWCEAADREVLLNSHLLNKMKDNLRKLESLSGTLAVPRSKPEDIMKKLRDLYEKYVDERLRDGWKQCILDPQWGGDSRREVRTGNISLASLAAEVLVKRWQVSAERLEALAKHLKDNMVRLEPEVVEWLRKSLDDIDRIALDQYETCPVNIVAPVTLVVMRAQLGLLTPQVRPADMVLQNALDDYGPGPIELVLSTFCRSLTATLDTALNDNKLKDKWSATVRQVIKDKKEVFSNAIRRVLNANTDVENLLADRGRKLTLYGKREIGPTFELLDAGEEDFERLMAPLPKMLRELLRADKEERAVVANEIMKLVLSQLPDDISAEIRREAVPSEDRARRWIEFMRKLENRFESRDRLLTIRAMPETMLTVIADLVESTWLQGPISAAVMMDEEKLDERLLLIKAYCEGFITFWTEQTEFITSRLGGDSGLEEIMTKCRSKVFGRGLVRPTIQQNRLVIGLPRMRQSYSRQRTAEARGYLLSRLRLAAQKSMNMAPHTTRRESSHPFVYYEEVYRSGAEILEIKRYHESYAKQGLRYQALFHIDPKGVALPDFSRPDNADWTKRICGNPGCEYDLTTTPRGRLSCPGCGGPIINRCGNPVCHAADLTAKCRKWELDPQGMPVENRCPDCEGQFLTRYWRCSEPEHYSRWLRSSTNDCPQCIREYREGRRKLADVRRFNDDLAFDCPGCLTLRVPPERRQSIPRGLRDYFFDGVTPGRMVEYLKTATLANFPNDGHCREGGVEHFRLPTLVDEGDSGRRQRPLYRDGAEFIAELGDPPLTWSCFHCGHPIAEAAVAMSARAEPVQCPRCLRKLQECVYCSHHDKVMLEPNASATDPVRCPRCANLMQGQDRKPLPFSRKAGDKLKRAGYCRNLFGCRAAALPWGSASNYDHRDCRACSPASPRSALIRFEELENRIKRCPLCLTLIGLPEGDRIVKASGETLINSFCDTSAKELQTTCRTCGTTPIAVLNWMVNTEYFKEIDSATEDKYLALMATVDGKWPAPEFSAAEGLEFLAGIIATPDNEDFRDNALSFPMFRRDGKTPMDVLREFEKLFAKKSLSLAAISRKFSVINKQFEDDRGREDPDPGDYPF